MFNIDINYEVTCELNVWNISVLVSLARSIDLEKNQKLERSSHRRFSLKTPVLEYLFSKVAGLKVCNFINKILQHRCFPMNIAKFLRTPILKNISERLILVRDFLLSKYSNICLVSYCRKRKCRLRNFLLF